MMDEEPDYASSLSVQYTTNGGTSAQALPLESYGTQADGKPLNSSVRVAAGLGAGTHNLQARWVVDGTPLGWSAAQSVPVTSTSLTSSNTISYGPGNEITLTLSASVPVGTFEDGEPFAVVDPAAHPNGIKVIASTPAPKMTAQTDASNGDAHISMPDGSAFNVITFDGTTTRTDRITKPSGGWASHTAARDAWNAAMVNTGVVWSTTLSSGTYRWTGTVDIPGMGSSSKLSLANHTGTPLSVMGFDNPPEWTATLRNGASVDVTGRSHGLQGDHPDFKTAWVYDHNAFIKPGQVLLKVQSGGVDPNNDITRLLTLTILSRRPPAGSFRPQVYGNAARKIYNWTQVDLGRIPRVNYDSAAMPPLNDITNYRLARVQRPAPALGGGSLGARKMFPGAQAESYHQFQRSSWAFPCVLAMASAANMEAAATASGLANPAAAGEAERIALIKAHIQRMIDVVGNVQSHITTKTTHWGPYLWIAPVAFAGTLLGEPTMRGAGDIAFGYGDYNFDGNGELWHLCHWSDFVWKAANPNVTGKRTNYRNINKTGATSDDFAVTKSSLGSADTVADNSAWPDVWAPLLSSRTVCTYTPAAGKLAEKKADLEARGLTVTSNGTNLTVTAPANRTWYGGRYVWFESGEHRCSQESLLYPWAERPTNADGTRVNLSGSRVGWGSSTHGKTYDQQHRYYQQHGSQSSTMAIIANAVAAGPYMARRTTAGGNAAKKLQDEMALQWMAMEEAYMVAAGAKPNMGDKFGRIDLDQTVSAKGWIENGYRTRFPSFAPTFSLTVPSQVTRRMFSMAPNGSGSFTVTLTDSPHDGYSILTDFEAQVNGAPWQSMGVTQIGVPWTYPIGGPGTHEVSIRGRNALGVGPASGIKSVTVA